MQYFLVIVALGAILSLIWYLGSGQFGRDQTQSWIDRVGQRSPRLQAFLNRHHGRIRASAHYIEFGGLFLVLYWGWDLLFRDGNLAFHPAASAVIAIICVIGAYLDEMNQLRSGSRQFRRVDFLHSCCGIAIAAGIICYQAVLRGAL